MDQKQSCTDNKYVKNSVHFNVAKYGIFPQFIGGVRSPSTLNVVIIITIINIIVMRSHRLVYGEGEIDSL